MIPLAMRRQPTAALVEMLTEDQANGIDPFDDPTPPLVPGPPVHVPPLIPLAIPPADWRAEERAALARENAGQPDPEPPPPESLTRYPAKPRQKSATPNLDRVKANGDGR